MQYFVDFPGLRPARQRSGAFAQFELPSDALEKILEEWPASAVWEARSKGKETAASGGYHPTAIPRKAVPAPIREYIKAHPSRRGKVRRILYHGVGRDQKGAKALEDCGMVTAYDPNHPDESIRSKPTGKFVEVHSHYVLNVVSQAEGRELLAEILSYLEGVGVAVVTVRRDLPAQAIRDSPSTTIFAKRLREARNAAGVSLAALAGELGLASGKAAVQAYECGRVEPKIGLVQTAAQALGVKPGWLAGWE